MNKYLKYNKLYKLLSTDMCLKRIKSTLKDLKGGVNGEHNYCYHEILQILFTLDEIKFEKFTNRLHLKFKRNYWKIEMNLRAFTTLNNFAGEFRKLESLHAHP